MVTENQCQESVRSTFSESEKAFLDSLMGHKDYELCQEHFGQHMSVEESLRTC